MEFTHLPLDLLMWREMISTCITLNLNIKTKDREMRLYICGVGLSRTVVITILKYHTYIHEFVRDIWLWPNSGYIKCYSIISYMKPHPAWLVQACICLLRGSVLHNVCLQALSLLWEHWSVFTQTKMTGTPLGGGVLWECHQVGTLSLTEAMWNRTWLYNSIHRKSC